MKLAKNVTAMEQMADDGTKTVRGLELKLADVVKEESSLQTQLLTVTAFDDEQKLKTGIFHARKAAAALRVELSAAQTNLDRVKVSLDAARVDLHTRLKADAIAGYDDGLATVINHIYSAQDAVASLLEKQVEIQKRYPEVTVPDAHWLEHFFANDALNSFKVAVEKYQRDFLRSDDPTVAAVDAQRARDKAAFNGGIVAPSRIFQQ